MAQIVTGDAVLLDLRPARIPPRVLATAIDLVVIGPASFLISFLVGRLGGSAALQEAVAIAGVILVIFGYPIATETVSRGWTLGR